MSGMPKTASDRVKDANEIIRKQLREIRDYKQQVAELQTEKDTAEAIREEIYGLAAHTPKPPNWLAGKGVPNGGRGGPVLIISDIHYGEVVQTDEVGGVNIYNAKTAERRLKKLAETTIDLATNHMGRAKVAYPGIVVALGGDMISGSIHEELEISNDKTPHQGVNDLTDILAGVIDTMATKFGRVFIPAVVGNHGRSTHKGRYKGRVYTNFDWNIYCNLERCFRGNKHVQFMIPNEPDARFDVFSTRFLLTHGDLLGTAGGDGIIGCVGPILRGGMKIGRAEATIGRDFDYLLLCHYHQLTWLPKIIVNGCVKGFDEYARLKLRIPYEPPSQALFFVHPEHGITARWPVFLEPKKNSMKENSWTSWQT
jgi:hypothetical protein